jgi:hypothetical protein
MRSVPKVKEARGTTGAASVAALCMLSMCAGGAYAVDAAHHARAGSGHHVVPIPRIHERPNKHTDLRWALFTLTDKERGTTFRCSLDGSNFIACSPRVLYGLIEARIKSKPRCETQHARRGARRTAGQHCAPPAKRSGRGRTHLHTHSVLRGVGKLLSLGPHIFRVRARSWSGRISQPATYTWTILTRAQLEALNHPSPPAGTGSGSGGTNGEGTGAGGSGGSGGGSGAGGGGGSAPIAKTKGFLISGQPEGMLMPGGSPLAIPLTLFNPNPVPIYVTSLTVAVASSPPGCSAEENLLLTQSDVSGAKPVLVPASSGVTLPAQEVSAPTIELLNLPVNQDACKNASFPLKYTGNAHS